ncbi:MAG: hypothetical protein KatS3mg050_4918 [Litorilinea sp.]|nr:MAG: hypothetical protein KatS3mg050_4918 [Litorilinea sp.]
MARESVASQFWQAVSEGDDSRAEALVAQLGAEDVPSLTEQLRSTQPDIRWWAARALAQVGDARAVSGLAGALADPEAAVRAVAVRALAQLSSRCPDPVRTCLPAMAALLRDPDGLVRQAAADALALCGEDAVPLLAEILARGSAPERSRAAYALRKMACLPAAVVLYRYLDDENLLVQTHAYEGLDDLGYLENTLLLP